MKSASDMNGLKNHRSFPIRGAIVAWFYFRCSNSACLPELIPACAVRLMISDAHDPCRSKKSTPYDSFRRFSRSKIRDKLTTIPHE